MAERDQIAKFGEFLEELLSLANSARGRGDRMSQNFWALNVLHLTPSRVSNWKGRSVPDEQGLEDLANALLKEYNREVYRKMTGRQDELAARFEEIGLNTAFMRKFGLGTWAYKAAYRILGKREPIPNDAKAAQLIEAYMGANEEGRKIIWERFQQALDDMENLAASAAGTVKP